MTLKPFSSMTVEELEAERALWAAKTGNVPKLYCEQIDEWIRRKKEARTRITSGRR